MSLCFSEIPSSIFLEDRSTGEEFSAKILGPRDLRLTFQYVEKSWTIMPVFYGRSIVRSLFVGKRVKVRS